MCGIAGIIWQDPSRPGDLAAATRMARALAHRGPDGEGVEVLGPAALAHRRLSIVDLSPNGRQPLSNEDGTIWITYNGEVYNHLDLRRELEARGHVFRTRSDTEAIVHAYEEWGLACVERLRGMFAFAIWDAPRRRLVLARDRLGIKPIYYARIGGDLLFASDLRALLLEPAVDRALDEDALACYLALRYVPAPRTMVRGVRKLPPASLLVWEPRSASEGPRVHRYWDLAPLPTLDGTPPTEAEAAAQLRERIDECVRLRLMSEVPLGAFLSGGLDSTMVTASMLATNGGAPLRTFSVGYEDEVADSELAWASLAAHALGTQHREVHVSAVEATERLSRIVSDLDEPVADPACVPLWFLARRAREEVTVVLSGEGADEILGGYATYRWMARMERLRAGGLGAAARALGRLLPSGRLRRASRLAGMPLERRYRGVARAFDGEGLGLLLDEAAARAADRTVEATLAPHWEATRGMTPLRRMLYLDTSVWLPDDLLVKADKMTMATAIELRVPLLDHTLVEHAWALPDRFKVDGGLFGGVGEGKRLLRRAARGRVPQAILDRPKKGFATPTAGWLRGRLVPLLYSVLLDPGSLARDRFRRAHVEGLLAEHRHGRADHSPELWTLLVLELWRREIGRVGAQGIESPRESEPMVEVS